MPKSTTKQKKLPKHQDKRGTDYTKNTKKLLKDKIVY